MFGLYLEDPLDAQECELWPEHLLAAQVFSKLVRQWQVGPMGGVLCLNFPALEVVMNTLQIPAADRPGLLDQICVMEDAGISWHNAE